MDLTELADHHVAADADEVPPSPAGALLARHLGISAVDPLLAAGVWCEVLACGEFRSWLRDTGASWAVYDDVHTAVVPHAGGARHDLVVFDPERDPGADPLVAPVDPPAFMAVRRGTRSAVVRHLSELASSQDVYAVFTVVEALEQFAADHVFAVVVIPAPEFAPVATRWAPHRPGDVPGYRAPVVVLGAGGPEASVVTGTDPGIAGPVRDAVRVYLRHAGRAIGVSTWDMPDRAGCATRPRDGSAPPPRI